MNAKTDKQIAEYIEKVCKQIKYRAVHRQIKAELENHFCELVENFLAEGFSGDEAVNKAIEQMGDAELVGKELNSVHKPKPDWWLLIFTSFFIGVGLITLYTMKKTSLLAGPNAQFFEKTFIYAFLGFVLAIAAYFIDYTKIKPYSKHIYLGTLVVLIITLAFGIKAFGKPYLRIGSICIDFIGICPLLFMIALSGLFDNWNWGNTKKAAQGLALGIIPAVFILMSPSTTTFIIYIISLLALLYASKVKPAYLLTVLGACLVISGLFLFNNTYRINRLLYFLHPQKDPHGAGYLNIVLDEILKSAGLMGQGLTFKPVLPGIHTDFILSYIIYTFGWISGIILIAAVAAFLVRILHIGRSVADSYGKLLTVSFTSLFGIQFLWNILMTLGLAPVVGIGLPFISYGGSQIVTNMLAIGILSSICGRKNVGVDPCISDPI